MTPKEKARELRDKFYMAIPGDEMGECYESSKQYPIGGYAPGFYSCKCVNCKIEFTVDKRAVQCKPCAIKMTQEETKQDLEEAAEIYSEYQLKGMADKSSKFECVNDFISGAKLQAERMYSEEEVLNILHTYSNHFEILTTPKFSNDMFFDMFFEWFKQFKKK